MIGIIINNRLLQIIMESYPRSWRQAKRRALLTNRTNKWTRIIISIAWAPIGAKEQNCINVSCLTSKLRIDIFVHYQKNIFISFSFYICMSVNRLTPDLSLLKSVSSSWGLFFSPIGHVITILASDWPIP